jgi:hypothetical protein
MTFAELQKRATKLFGRRWRPALAKELGRHLATVYRWEPKEGRKVVDVPDYVDMFFNLHEQRKKLERFARSLVK